MLTLIRVPHGRVVVATGRRSLATVVGGSSGDSNKPTVPSLPPQPPQPITRKPLEVVERTIRSGPGGRSSNSGISVCIFGATGFVGRYVTNRIGRSGAHLVIPYRGDPYDIRPLRVMADLGKFTPHFYKPKEYQDIERVVSGTDVVINLIGAEAPTRNFPFEETHVNIPARIAKACRETGVPRLIHVSALNAAVDSKSTFYASKGHGENAVLSEFPQATIVRPASIFGYEDRFVNRIPYMKHLPLFGDPVVRGGRNVYMPVYVGDVAQGIYNILQSSATAGKIFEFYGPMPMTHLGLLKLWKAVTVNPVRIVDYNPSLLKKAVGFYALFPNGVDAWPETIDRWMEDELPTPGLPTLRSLGVTPADLPSMAILFMRRYRYNIYHDMPENPIKYLEKTMVRRSDLVKARQDQVDAHQEELERQYEEEMERRAWEAKH